MTETLDDAAGAAQRNALVGAVLTLLALAAAIALAFFIARSLLGPIGKVRDGALAVARHRLPDAVARIRAGQEPEPIKTIDVHTNEEIGQVARAVDDLHRQAIHLASGEAQLRQTVNAMFVTLSRRSTSLVNQQLAQIERLEHDEEDPKRLESLFRLDHLASRMRRTADSLLILADAPNRAAGQFSLTVGEALQAATSGVQDYQRVQILSNLNTRVGDEAAADVVHLLTELVDNALSFSPPAEPVRLAAKQGPEGVTITITDSGLGVPPTELEQLNSDLQHGAEATPDTARRMGLFVVSRLAERHDITAHLARNPGGGMTASVVLPPSVLPDVSQSGAPAAPAATTTAAPSAPSTASTGSAELVGAAAAGPVVSKREARNRARAEKAEAKAAERAAAAEAKARAKAAKAEADLEPLPAATGTTTAADAASTQLPAAPAAPAAAASASEPTPDRPPLGSLLPRRDPGANMPRTGADAFLPPETSGATGPLFGKRADTAEPAAKTDSTVSRAPRPSAPRRSPASSRSPPWPRASVRRPSRRRGAPRSPPRRRLLSRPRSRWPRSPSTEPVEQPVEQPARAHDPLSDPLSDPLPADAFDEPAAAEQSEPEAEAEPEADVQPEPAAAARRPGRRGRGRRRRPAGPRSPGPPGAAGQPAGRRAGQPARAGARQRGRGRARGRAPARAAPGARARAGAVVRRRRAAHRRPRPQRPRHQRHERHQRLERSRQQRPVARCRAGPRRWRVPDLQVHALRLARRRGQGRVARDRGRPWLGDRRARLRAGAGRGIHAGRTSATCPR